MGWNTWPVIGLSLQGLFAPLFGLHIWTLRLSSALIGTLGVLVTYLLARELFAPRRRCSRALLFADLPHGHRLQPRSASRTRRCSASSRWRFFFCGAR